MNAVAPSRRSRARSIRATNQSRRGEVTPTVRALLKSDLSADSRRHEAGRDPRPLDSGPDGAFRLARLIGWPSNIECHFSGHTIFDNRTSRVSCARVLGRLVRLQGASGLRSKHAHNDCTRLISNRGIKFPFPFENDSQSRPASTSTRGFRLSPDSLSLNFTVRSELKMSELCPAENPSNGPKVSKKVIGFSLNPDGISRPMLSGQDRPGSGSVRIISIPEGMSEN
jgi:hypothetical protein